MNAPARSTPKFPDSIEKMMHRISRLAKAEVYYKGKLLGEAPDSIYVSPALLREFRCVSGCTACCCVRITIDFMPEEFDTFGWTDEVRKDAERLFKLRQVEVNGKVKTIRTYRQHADPACHFLQPMRGNEQHKGCAFFLPAGNGSQPLECAIAPQLSVYPHGAGSIVTKRPFSRAWAFKETPQCEFEPVFKTRDEIPAGTGDVLLANEILLLRRLHKWAEFFEVDTYLPEVIEALQKLPDTLREKPALHTIRVI